MPLCPKHAGCHWSLVSAAFALVQEKEGITICATIHCPSIETFRLFERVLLLQHGRVVYHGDNGIPILNYFGENFPQVGLRSEPGCILDTPVLPVPLRSIMSL